MSQQTDLSVTGPSESGHGDGFLDDDEKDTIRSKYPSLAYLLDDPEIARLLDQALLEGWRAGDPQMSTAVENTNWFKATDASRRQFDAAEQRDPATIAKRVQQQHGILFNMFSAYGVDIPSSELQKLAHQVTRDGLDPNEIARLVGEWARHQAASTPGLDLGGTLLNQVDTLKQMASQYFLSYTDDEFEEMAIRISEGVWSIEGATAQMKQQAAQFYPHLAERLDEGMTVESFYMPMKAKLAQYLNMNANDIDLRDDRWSAVTQQVDDGSGPRSMSFTELDGFARQQREWQATPQAASEGYSLANTLLETFGLV